MYSTTNTALTTTIPTIRATDRDASQTSQRTIEFPPPAALAVISSAEDLGL